VKFLAPGQIMKITPAKKVGRSIDFLTSKRGLLQNYESLEEFIDALISDPSGKSALSGIEFHLVVLRNAVLKELRRNGVFIGASIIESLAFDALRDASNSDPFRTVLEWIRDSDLHRPGLLIFPLHGVGILGFGAFRALGRAGTMVEFVLKKAGLVFSPQTNSDRETISMIRRAAKHLGISHVIPRDNLEHHLRFSGMDWMTRNPLLFVRLRAVSGETFENQRFLTMKLRLAASLLIFIHTLETTIRGPKPPQWSSSRFVNNWETLDIKHYLFYQSSGKGGRLEGLRVPIVVNQVELTELSDLGIDLRPKAWTRRTAAVDRVKRAFDKLERSYLRNVLTSNKSTSLGRTTRKLYDSLKHFRRSFRSLSEPDEAYVNLAIAFETLLVDGGNAAPKMTITNRLKAALKGVPRSELLVSNVRKTYLARNEVVHSGSASTPVNLRLAQTAFTHCFIRICTKLHKLQTVPNNCSSPIGELLGI
jgi:hypothetical protein